MAGLSTIEWTNFTFNFISGCEFASEACRNCYADYETNDKADKFILEVIVELGIKNARGTRGESIG